MKPRSTRWSTSWSKKHDKHTAMRLLGSAGIPAGAVLDTKELAEDKTFYERGIMQEMDAPRQSRTTPFRRGPCGTTASRRPSRPRRCSASIPATCCRAGSASSEREIEGLAADKIITQRK